MIRLILLPIALSAALACSEKKSNGSDKGGDPATGQGTDKTNGDQTTPTRTGLPPLELELVDAKKQKLAREKNSAALKKQKASDYAAAIALYKEALEADPGHVLARYNLASAYAKKGEKEPALAILAELRAKPNCLVCQGRLIRAKVDSDFAAFKGDPGLKKLTDGVTVKTPKVKEATLDVLASLAGNELPRDLIHPRRPIILKAPSASRNAVGNAAAKKAVAKWSLADASVKSCSKNCCTLGTKGNDSSKIHLERLCFDKDSGGVRTLRRIEYRKGGKSSVSFALEDSNDYGWFVETEGFPVVSPSGDQVAVANHIEHGCSDMSTHQIDIYKVGSTKPAKTITLLDGGVFEEDSGKKPAEIRNSVNAEIEKAKKLVKDWRATERVFTDADDESQELSAGDVKVTYKSPKLVVTKAGKELYSKSHPEWVDKAVDDFEAPFEDRLAAIYRSKDSLLVEIAYFHGPHCDSRSSAFLPLRLK